VKLCSEVLTNVFSFIFMISFHCKIVVVVVVCDTQL